MTLLERQDKERKVLISEICENADENYCKLIAP